MRCIQRLKSNPWRPQRPPFSPRPLPALTTRSTFHGNPVTESLCTVIDYLRMMWSLALRMEPQGLHFWSTAYVVFVLCGSLLHAVRVRRWPHTEGRLRSLGVRPFGCPNRTQRTSTMCPTPSMTTSWGTRITRDARSPSGRCRPPASCGGSAAAIIRQVRVGAFGEVRVYYHPQKPHKSLLVRPGWPSLAWPCAAIGLVVFYYWRRW